MRIGIDARTIRGRKTGDRSYTLGLIGGLAQVNQALGNPHEFVLYLDGEPPNDLPCAADGELMPGWSVRIVRARFARMWTLWALPRAARADALDVLHVQYNAPRMRRPAVVTTVHDITFRLFPDWFTLKDRLLLGWGLRATLRTAAGTLTVSECTRQDLERVYGLAPETITVTPNALASGFARPSEEATEEVMARLGVQRPYALFVGVLQPRKNIERMVGAMIAARDDHGLDHRLVVAGKVGWKAGSALETVRAAEVAGVAQYLGYVADEDLPALYAGADLFLFATLYEGFGIPVLEAFACGTPVITSNVSALPEVAGDAALLIDPRDEAEIASAIALLARDEDLRADLIARGHERVKRFSWTRSAELTLEAYERAVTST